jgi:hypothetical protein
MNSCQQSIVNYKNLNGITGSGIWSLDTLTDSATGITYKIYSFTGGANTVSLTTNSKWYYLCIGGGGNGGDCVRGGGGGGGGAGGYLDGSFNNINGKISINTNVNLSTKDSIISGDINITSKAGGKGGVNSSTSTNQSYTNGATGGSGGGAPQGQPAVNYYGQGTSGQGYMGYQSGSYNAGGGGGAAGGIYKTKNGVTTLGAIPPATSSAGMDGKKCTLPGISLKYTNYYCAGGGGGGNVSGSNANGGSGGAGGFGVGGLGTTYTSGGNATTYGSGGGGMGSVVSKSGGNGYQGIIVIAFAT